MRKVLKHYLGKWFSQPLAKWSYSLLLTVLLLTTINSLQLNSEGSILDQRIQSLMIEKSDMRRALQLLRQNDPSRILIGFEKVSGKQGGEEPKISLQLANASVTSIVDRLCQADPRYTYEIVEGTLINVFPKGAKSDPNNLLNIRVQHFQFHGDELPNNLITRISDLAPELREHLWMRAREYAKKTGRPLGGSAGSILSGNAPLPRIDINLQNMTVREILNAIVLYSMKLSNEPPGWTPISWQYEFIIDPTAPTGLGGYPKWDIFY
uniref:Uncharacterized protein n=1 Tax=Oscillatoriales cyanobacterium SpSt-418 TaxID=2282169 RepID=A0A7C3PF43_9CYAN